MKKQRVAYEESGRLSSGWRDKQIMNSQTGNGDTEKKSIGLQARAKNF